MELNDRALVVLKVFLLLLLFRQNPDGWDFLIGKDFSGLKCFFRFRFRFQGLYRYLFGVQRYSVNFSENGGL